MRCLGCASALGLAVSEMLYARAPLGFLVAFVMIGLGASALLFIERMVVLLGKTCASPVDGWILLSSLDLELCSSPIEPLFEQV